MTELALVQPLYRSISMEAQHIRRKTIWGNWWEPIRKWFYLSWLLYELTYSFSQYSIATYHYIAEISNQTLAVLGAISAFTTCTIFLSVSSCFILYKFFQTENLTKTSFEEKVKWYF